MPLRVANYCFEIPVGECAKRGKCGFLGGQRIKYETCGNSKRFMAKLTENSGAFNLKTKTKWYPRDMGRLILENSNLS